MTIKKLINRLKKSVKGLIVDEFVNSSYSQEGEDLILSRYFQDKTDGFYVDIGAHHPKRFSNTYKFYLKGWHGINIDAMPGSMKLFKRIRPRDINIEVPVSDTNTILKYYIFNETALNTLNEAEAQSKSKIESYYIKETVELTTERLDQILDKHLPGNIKKIDFLSIDVEGLDLQVLQSNNWKKYRPVFVLVEELRVDLETIIATSPVYLFMKSVGYSLVSRSYNTSFYMEVI